jgi:quinol monooxygenase YgiN
MGSRLKNVEETLQTQPAQGEKMVKLFVHHKVQDYSAWRKVFDALASTRAQFGSTGQQVFQSPTDPNEITILTDWNSVEEAKAYATSAELKEGMKNAGVISQPDVMFLAEV